MRLSQDSQDLRMKEEGKKEECNKTFFAVRVVRRWKRFSREVVECPFVEMLRAQLGTALGYLLQLMLLQQESWARWSQEDTLNLNQHVTL